jgi:cyclopropane-fatty-acyl-phospholipid synthase
MTLPFIDARLRREFLDTCSRTEGGRLTLVTPDGVTRHFGSGGVEADLTLRDWSVIPTLVARGGVGLGETYAAGLWDTNSIEALIQLAYRNMDRIGDYADAGLWNRLKFRLLHGVVHANSRRGAARNIRAHYDVGNEFYQLWLDPSMTYSSGIFAPGDDDLGRAQGRKYDRILDRLGEGERVLEIGCGWGGFAERAADQGRSVTGITISPSQKGFADARLDGRAEIRLQDYRATSGRFDNIVSIEMVEAVGERYWPVYFANLRDRLATGARAVVQAITVPDARFAQYRKTQDYVRQHVFPGGMLLSDGVIASQASRAGLQVKHSYSFGPDYAETCRQWARRLTAAAGKVRALGHEPAFLRGWLFYLESCAAAFATGRADVVQVDLAHAEG